MVGLQNTVVAAGAGFGAGVRAYGVCLLGRAPGGGAGGQLAVDASWLDASGAVCGVACLGGSLASARFVAPAGGAFGAGGVVDADGSVAARVTIEPVDATASAGESDVRGVPEDGLGEPAADDNPAADQPGAGSATDPVVKPVATSPKTTATKTTVTKTTATKTTKPKSTMATTPPLPKTGDSYWIAASITLFLPGTVLLGAAYRC